MTTPRLTTIQRAVMERLPTFGLPAGARRYCLTGAGTNRAGIRRRWCGRGSPSQSAPRKIIRERGPQYITSVERPKF